MGKVDTAEKVNNRRMQMSDITILTPTYNRGELLQKLYRSLCAQCCKDFEWLIIDDGSKDETEQYVNQMKGEADFSIYYHKKENGGKHTALNYAYQHIKTPLTFIVDSDDTLTPNAISIIQDIYEKYRNEKELCGFSFLRGKPEGGYLSDSGVPIEGMKETYVECRINRGIGGDMAEVWYTRCLKEYPFPIFEGEKFLGEDVVWIRMSEKYKMRFFNKVIYISNYLDDGLTNNRRKHNIASPRGCIARAEAFLESEANIRSKIKAMLQYQVYGKFAGLTMKAMYNKSGHKFLFLVLAGPAKILFLKWKSTTG